MIDPRLTIPDQSDTRDPTLEVNPKKLKLWVDDLPLGDISSATKMVFAALQGLNRTNLSAKIRFELLELYWPAMEKISTSLSKYYKGHLQPMPEANRKIAMSLRKLHGEYADGYKIVVMSPKGSDKQDWTRPNMVTTSLHRAMDLLGKVQLISHQAYLPQADKVWQEIHKLYLYARLRGAERVAVPLPGHPDRPGTLEEKYKLILLIDLSDPLRLEADQIPELIKYLESHIEQARVLAADSLSKEEAEGKQSLFVVRYEYDTGAATYGDLMVSDPEQGLLFEVGDLLATTHQHLQLIEQQIGSGIAQSEPSQTSLLTLRYINNSLGIRPERRYERQKSNGKTEIARGLGAATWVLNHRQPFTLPGGETDDFIEINSDGQPGQDAVMAHYETDHWEKVDFSEGGLALLRTQGAKSRVKIGDLLTIREASMEDRPESWSIAMVRRFRYQEDNSLLVGLQLLAPVAKLIAIKRVSDSSKELDYRQALLLAPNKQSGVGTSILTQSGYYRTNASYQINRKGKSTMVVAGKLVELSPAFDQFTFEKA